VFLEVVLDVFQPSGGSRLFLTQPYPTGAGPEPANGRATSPRITAMRPTGSMIPPMDPGLASRQHAAQDTGCSSGMGTNGIRS